MAEKIAKITRGDYVEPARIPLRDLMIEWLELNIKHRTSIKTYDLYQYLTHNFIIPHLGEIPLDKLSPIQIQKFYNKLLDMDKMHGEGKISTTTVRKVHKVLRAALDWGIKMKMLHSNVAKRVDPPKEKRTSVNVWTQEEASAFLEVSKGHRFYPLSYVEIGRASCRE